MADAVPFEDLDEYLDATEFARAVLVDAVSVLGILDKTYISDDGYSGAVVTLWAKGSDLASVTLASSVVDGVTAYRVAEIRPDGSGATTLVLEEV